MNRDVLTRAGLAFDPLAASRAPDEVWEYRALWCAVIENALSDLDSEAGYGESHIARRRTLDWIGSRDFREVCLLAGLEASVAERAIRARLKAGERFNLGNRRADAGRPKRAA